MATTRLSDAFVYDVYLSYQALNSPETTAFYEAGLVTRNSTLDAIARGAGKIVEVPWWNDLDATIEEDYTNDDPADMATPGKITSGTMKARKNFMHKAWSDMDLVSELTGSDPMRHIRNRFGVWWQRRAQRKLIAITQGVIADNIANDSGDMGIDISAASGSDAVFNSDAVVDASGTMGDMSGSFRAIAVHSRIQQRMIKNDDIIYIPDSSGRLSIPTYKGMRVVVDDNMPKTGSGDATIYTSVMFGGGAFGFGGMEGSVMGFGEGTPRNPAYTDRIELAGNGGGQEIIGERKTWIMHPFGFSFTADDEDLAEYSPTNAELAVATWWDRKVPRKNVPMAWLKSKA